jgi:hypothetical protein
MSKAVCSLRAGAQPIVSEDEAKRWGLVARDKGTRDGEGKDEIR